MSTEPTQDTSASTPAGDPAGVDARPARRLLLEIGIAVLLVVLLRAFVMQSFHVPSGSMEPTIAPGDRVVVAKVHGTIEPGDLVVLDGTDTLAVADRTPFVSDGVIGRTLSAIASTLSISRSSKFSSC